MRIFGGRRSENDRAEEIATHLSLLEDEYRQRGMSDAAARDAAQRALGGDLKTRQLYREASQWRWLDHVLHDVRVAARTLRRDRSFALVASIVLGLGIGVNNMQFTIIYSHTLRALPIPDAGRVLIGSFVDERGADRSVTYAEYLKVRDGATRFERVAAFGGAASVALGDEGRAPDRYLAVYTTASAFDVLRIEPLVGRTFTDDEENVGGTRVALLGGGAWRQRYSADPALVGRDVLVDGKRTTVIGVVEERSGFPSTAEVFLPVVQAPRFADDRDQRILRAIGRARQDVSAEEAQAQLSTLLANATTESSARPLLPSVGPITSRFRGRATDPGWIAFYAVSFLVVAVACANAANLLLARGIRRGREMAIRSSLGATRGRILFGLLIESVVLAGFGAIVGAGVSLAGVRLFRSGIPPDAMPYWFDYSIDANIFFALVAVAFLTVLLFGLVPALQTSRLNASGVLKDGGWSGSSRRTTRWLSTSFMVAQLALSIVLTSYVARDFSRDEATTVASDAAIETSDVLTAAVTLPADRYAVEEQRRAFLAQLHERIRELPGITAATITNRLPRTGATQMQLHHGDAVDLAQQPTVWSVLIAPDYFRTLDVPLRAGREFAEHEPTSVAIVNERFVTLHMPGEDPIGRQVTLVSPTEKERTQTTATIVGVAQDIRHMMGTAVPVVYLHMATAPPPALSLMVRVAIDPDAALRQLRAALLTLDPNLPTYQVNTLAQVVYDAGWNIRASSRLVDALSIIVLLLATAGLYAVTVHAVSQRAKEIAIRIAMGAQPREIRRLVISRAAWQVALGLLFGVPLTIVWDGAFSSSGAAGNLADPRVLASLAFTMVAVMALACTAPIRRAMHLDPVRILRQD